MSKKTNKNQLKIFVQEVLEGCNKHKTEQLGAALAFYAVIALPSLVILIILLGSFYLNTEQIKTSILEGLSHVVGSEILQALNTLLDSIIQSQFSGSLTLLGLFALIWSASLFFEHIINSLNYLWGVTEKPQKKLKKFLLNRLLSLFFIILMEIFLFLPLFIGKITFFLKGYLKIEGQWFAFLFSLINFIFTFISPFLLFFFIFKFLANVKITSKDASIGALMTTILFMIGNFLLSIYFAHFVDFSAFGTASTLILLLIWLYYTAQILFLGAEFTFIYSNKYGSKILPNKK